MSKFDIVSSTNLGNGVYFIAVDLHQEDDDRLNYRLIVSDRPDLSASVRAVDEKTARILIKKILRNREGRKRYKRLIEKVSSLRRDLRLFLDISKEDISKNLVDLENFLSDNADRNGSLYHFELCFELVIQALYKAMNQDNKREARVVSGRLLECLTTELYQRKSVDWLKGKLLTVHGDFAESAHIDAVLAEFEHHEKQEINL